MHRSTLLLALFLIAVGVTAYFATGRQSLTALIPAFLGLPLLLCALATRTERLRKGARIGAMVLALAGLGGTVSGAVKTVRLLGGATLERPEAAVVQAIVALACLAYLGREALVLAKARRAEAASA